MKKEYNEPTLTSFGSIGEITENPGNGNVDGAPLGSK